MVHFNSSQMHIGRVLVQTILLEKRKRHKKKVPTMFL